MQRTFKIGDTIKIRDRLFDDDGNAIDISGYTIRSIFKKSTTELVGTIQRPDDFTVISVFDTTDYEVGNYQTDIRFTIGDESYSSPTQLVILEEGIS
jgi:hypothetical protein